MYVDFEAVLQSSEEGTDPDPLSSYRISTTIFRPVSVRILRLRTERLMILWGSTEVFAITWRRKLRGPTICSLKHQWNLWCWNSGEGSVGRANATFVWNVLKLGTKRWGIIATTLANTGTVYQKCNFRYAIPHYIPVVFHNLSGYDTHLFIRELGKKFDSGSISVIAENKEKYISFYFSVIVGNTRPFWVRRSRLWDGCNSLTVLGSCRLPL